MKKKKPDTFVSNNPMMDGVAQVELPIIGAEAYDAPLPYTRTESHVRRSGDGMRKIKYPTTGSVADVYSVPPVIFGDEEK